MKQAATFDQKRSAGSHVAAKLRALDAALTLAIPRVVGGLDDDAIHDLRVTIRRMRTLLKIARPLFGRFHADAVRRAFADFMRATSGLRDHEVLLETIEGLSDSPAFAKWQRSCAAREKKLRRAVAAAIERGELDDARVMLKALLVFPFDPARDVPLSRFARRKVEGARRKVARNQGMKPADTVALHALRIAYKELQYSLELLSEGLPRDTQAMLEPSTTIQKRLGEIHDADVAIQTLQKARGLPREVRVEALASLATLRAKRVSRCLRDLARHL
jgi:CHAD domain-containing protein